MHQRFVLHGAIETARVHLQRISPLSTAHHVVDTSESAEGSADEPCYAASPAVLMVCPRQAASAALIALHHLASEFVLVLFLSSPLVGAIQPLTPAWHQ